MALDLQIKCLKLKVHLENTPWLEFHQTLHRLSLSGPICLSKILKSGVTSHAVHIGGAKVTNNVIFKWKCHFGATYMDGMTF